MSWSYSLGKIGGTVLRVHVTFVLLIIWITATAWAAEGPQAALVNMLFILSVFACVVLHEFGHATMAARFGVRTPDITLLPIGGLARLERIPENPKQEILIAVAGPAVNVVIFLILTIFLGGRGWLSDLQSLDNPAQSFWGRLALVNALLVAFNLIPAFPMDGGRVFRAALALFMDRVKATQVAARTGQVIALLFAYWGLTSGNPILVLIAVFIFFAAGSESSDAAMRGLAHRAAARDAVITSFVSLTPNDTIDTAAQAILHSSQSEFPVLSPEGQILGFVTRESVLARPDPEFRQTPVSEIMFRDVPVVSLKTGMDDVLDAFARQRIPAVAVVGANGNFVGFINRENIGEWFILARAPSVRRGG
ncbi:site-2 protease family protein [Thioclava nitratireducens]|uniref:site-2 protease family protein n=1 Tax=Thioclava nitratireducens TaxID=1915078 RepID=UPI002480007C|nr:site-2 protease family protein [Thioclava nitratireducens]WGT50514.1 site-2 protease family protein [Thioclava nitratireducens]